MIPHFMQKILDVSKYECIMRIEEYSFESCQQLGWDDGMSRIMMKINACQ